MCIWQVYPTRIGGLRLKCCQSHLTFCDSYFLTLALHRLLTFSSKMVGGLSFFFFFVYIHWSWGAVISKIFKKKKKRDLAAEGFQVAAVLVLSCTNLDVAQLSFFIMAIVDEAVE